MVVQAQEALLRKPMPGVSPAPGKKDYFFHLDDREGILDLYDIKKPPTALSSPSLKSTPRLTLYMFGLFCFSHNVSASSTVLISLSLSFHHHSLQPLLTDSHRCLYFCMLFFFFTQYHH